MDSFDEVTVSLLDEFTDPLSTLFWLNELVHRVYGVLSIPYDPFNVF